MKFILAYILFSVAFITPVQAASLAVVLGAPDLTLPFVNSMIEKQVHYRDRDLDVDFSTQLFSVLSQRGVKSVWSYKILPKENNFEDEDLLQALTDASVEDHMLVAFTAFEGSDRLNSKLCARLALLDSTAFVLGAGNRGQEKKSEPACLSPNILQVAALNEALTGLNHISNFGSSVRLAAPGSSFTVVGKGGLESELTGTSVAAAWTAAELAKFAEIHAELKGADLIENFLNEKAVVLPTLRGKIVGEKAILH